MQQLTEHAAAGRPVRPSTLEREVAAVWREVLGVEVGPEDSFYALGGDSVQAMQIAARLSRRLERQVPVRAVLAWPTPRALAEDLADGGEAAPPELAADGGDRGPASPEQERLFFLTQAQPASSPAYNVHLAVRLLGPLALDALRESLTALVARHDALRTRLEATPEGVQATVLEPQAPEVEVVDATGEELAALLARAAAREFELGSPPLLRALLARVAPDEHVLLLVAHHAVLDGWGFALLVDDLSRLYAAQVEGAPPPPSPRVRSLDAARWRRERTAAAAPESLGRWQRRLEGAARPLELVADLPRPPVPSYRGGRVSRRLPDPLVARVAALAPAIEATPFACYLAAFGALLGRAARRKELLVAAPATGRPLPELERVVGCFVDTLVIPIGLEGRPSFRELVARSREAAFEAFDHAALPLARLVAELAPDRDASRHPLAEVAFAYQGRRPRPALPGVTARHVPVDNGTAKFDLTLEIEELEEGTVVATLEHADVFTPQTAESLLERFVALLEGCAAEPDRPVADQPLVGARERRRLTASAPGPLPSACLHELFRARAERTPDAVAVSCGESSLTYRELAGHARALGGRLRELGAGPEARVGVCLERSCELVAAIVGVLEAGAAYVPLDPVYPRERLRSMVEDAGCRLVVADAASADLLPPDVLAVPPDATETAEAPPTPASPAAAAYVIYTSGSTGRPKGVVVTHANVVRLFEAASRELRLEQDDVWTLFHSFAFDFSVWELWGALLHGGRLVVVPAATSRSPQDFLELLRRERVTVLNQTPTAFRQLQAAATAEGFPPTSLRLVVFGGEALDPRVLRPWLDAYGERPQLVNMYGITETTVHVTLRPLVRDDLERAGSPIGAPLADLSLLVLDERLEPLPAGFPGELHVGGAGLARGYLHRPAETAQRFLPDPYGPPGSRLYRSGDVAARRAGGELLYLGRADAQLKLRGFRIEPGEIEAALLEHPAVGASAVALRPERSGEPRLAGYVVARPGQTPTARGLRRFLAQRLPAHMIPAAFALVPALPTTPNGKLDREALPELDVLRDSEPDHVPPRTADERRLAEIWSRVLGVERVGAGDNFFALGGDSILSVRVAAEAAQAGLALSLEELYRRPTLAELAASARRPSAAADAPSVDDGAPFPVTPLQLGMIYHSEATPGLYHDLVSVRVEGRFDTAALRAALDALCARHELLRVSFDLIGGDEPLQLVHPHVEPPLELEDLSALPEAEQEAALARWRSLEPERPFDWERPPLLRCHAAQLAERTFQVTLATHHAVLDGWSLARALTDLLLLYGRELGEASAPPPPPAVSYRELVRLEREARTSAETAAFWKSTLLGAAATLPRPDDTPGPRPDRLVAPLDPDLLLRLDALAAARGLPLKSLALAAHVTALAAVLETSDVVTGLVVDGHPEVPGAERLVGLYLNVVPLRVAVAPDVLETARAALAAEAALLPYRRCPATQIQRLTGVFPDVLFNYAHFHVYRELDALEALDVVDWWYFDHNSFPVTVEFVVESFPDQVSLQVDRDPQAADAEVARALAEGVEAALAHQSLR